MSRDAPLTDDLAARIFDAMDDYVDQLLAQRPTDSHRARIREVVRESLAAVHAKSAEPAVAWRCKDYADGWIVFQQERDARTYQEDTGCLMQRLGVPPPAPKEPRCTCLSSGPDYCEVHAS